MVYDQEHDNRRWAIAWHEAAHAIAALEVGLPVDWVDIDGGYAEGIGFTAAVHIPDEMIDRERDAKAIAVAMACPSFTTDRPDAELDRYARLEAVAAYEMAGAFGIDSREVMEEAEWIAEWKREEIYSFALLLVQEGRIEIGVPVNR